ncbi:hypothetical protein [Pseudomonas sp. KCJK9016]|uniref:hypothetical protein n=1 Tax=Pseudomonas sp. KCJK9016 TaxID=3344556 RepID=UPI003906A402
MSDIYFAKFLHFVCLTGKKRGYYPPALRVTNPAPEDCRASTGPAVAADRDHPGAVTHRAGCSSSLTLKWKSRFQLSTRFAIDDAVDKAIDLAIGPGNSPAVHADRAAMFFASSSPPGFLCACACDVSLHARAAPSS